VAKSLEEARKELDDEFEQVRRQLRKVHDELAKVDELGPEDDITEALKKLEDVVKEARTGGMIGSGSKGHREALEEYNKLKKGD